MKQKQENFSEWYNEVIELANLSDKRYPVKGMNVWTGYGWKIMRNIDELIRKYMEETGHAEVCFPLLISRDMFQKEAEHIKGFNEEVYWVTHAGKNKLEVPLLLRPTSETAMYPMFSLWIRSHADLPLKIFQIVNTFRYETKQTRSFIRVREIHFFEAHTCHVDFEDAERQIKEDLAVMRKLGRDLCLPYIVTKRPKWDTFPGAFYTFGIDTVMPTGRSLQLGSIHQYKTNFSVPYEIKYEDREGEFKYVHQTTYGMSERLVGALIGVHGDDLGLILPPKVAPYHAVIIPIPSKGNLERVYKEARLLSEELASAFRVFLDMEDVRPGVKFFKWERKGVPVRIEIGIRDIEKGEVVFVRRDSGERIHVKREEATDYLNTLLKKVQENLLARAEREMKKMILTIKEHWQDGEDFKGLLRFSWCGSEDCAEVLEKGLGIKILGDEVDHNGEYVKPDETLRSNYSGVPSCIVCGKPVPDRVSYGGKTF
ncbi:MAG TPA: proline--tRNA ligase [Thermoplasmata archaeon]|nr:proline--tRNA ligase [Thermoplasmata archaeon]